MPRIIVGDCFKVLPTLEPDSVDACVTDPPYGIGFMGKKWDNFTKPVLIGNQRFQSWCTAWSIELYHVLKPGGHFLAFGGTRTSHRLTCALENAGFEIRDCLMWLHGQGFPKSLDVSKAIDKAAGATRRVIGTKLGQPGYSTAPSKGRGSYNAAVDGSWQDSERECQVTEAATTDARKWQGWGTALKPAWEPIILARKPLSEPTVAANVLKWGTGALNIDGCRVGIDPNADASQLRTMRRGKREGGDGWGMSTVQGDEPQVVHPEGRWPANVLLDEEAAVMLNEQSGKLKSGVGNFRRKRHETNAMAGSLGEPRNNVEEISYGDSGGASRFFYCAKAARSERNAGCELLEPSRSQYRTNDPSENSIRTRLHGSKQTTNSHPTVKPIALIRYLCRLVTPPGGVILDPFAGTFTTGIAAILEGFDYILIEKDPKYVEIGLARLEHHTTNVNPK